MALILATPAMFFWGIGTSDIAQDSFNWPLTSSAATLAVATLVIPGVDSFLGSYSVEKWYSKVGHYFQIFSVFMSQVLDLGRQGVALSR